MPRTRQPGDSANEAKASGNTKTTMITYVPQAGDPSETVWNGHLFKANVARPVDHERHPQMIVQAKGNPWFTVEGHEPEPVDKDAGPTTPEEYRAHAVEWFKTVETYNAMQAMWRAEADLRIACGVGSDDIEYLMSLYVPRLAELKKAAAE